MDDWLIHFDHEAKNQDETENMEMTLSLYFQPPHFVTL